MPVLTPSAAWRDSCWRADAEMRFLHGSGAAHRSASSFGDVVTMDLGVSQPWGVQASAGQASPTSADIAAALDWCRARGSEHGWRVCVPESAVGSGDKWPWGDLTADDRLPMFAAATRATPTGRHDVPVELEIDEEPSYESVIAAYGGWMSDTALASLLVVPTDLDRPQRRFIVGRVDGREAGCAFVWWTKETGYLSGIGILPRLRGRGYGRALTAAAARLAASGADGRAAPDLVWMHATAEGAALYAGMGFRRIDTEVQLSPA